MKEFELIESSAWADFFHSVPKELIQKLKVTAFPVGGVFATIAPAVDILVFNRVIGLGIKEPIDERIIDIILNKIEAEKVKRFFIQVHPEVYSDKLRQLLVSYDFHHYNNWVRLVRDVSPTKAIKTKLVIKTISSEESDLFGEILVKAFEWPDELKTWIASPIGRKNWYHYMAYDGNNAIATAAFYHKDNYAWFDFAATHPDHREMGAQSALLLRRIEDCRKLGVKTIIVETAEQNAEKESPSYRNVLKTGFKEAYKRANYIFVKN